jgi:hypothetical protein
MISNWKEIKYITPSKERFLLEKNNKEINCFAMVGDRLKFMETITDLNVVNSFILDNPNIEILEVR